MNTKGTSLTALISNHQALTGYEDWEKKPISSLCTLEILPDLMTIVNQVFQDEGGQVISLVSRSIQRQSRTEQRLHGKAEPAYSFNVNEFARLLVLLRDDPQCRFAIQKAMGDQMDSIKLDNRVTRDSYWTIVEKRFNNKAGDSKESFKGFVDEIDSNSRPIKHRPGEQLKTTFFSNKAAFTKVFDRWSASGQNDPARIYDFLEYDGVHRTPRHGDSTDFNKVDQGRRNSRR
ncbi:hypothetical protein FGB62_409g04 [Gracilaria domingensis]|nr:hypothetical protein FGB62_409g04 [Gracilaria domingensis]